MKLIGFYIPFQTFFPAELRLFYVYLFVSLCTLFRYGMLCCVEYVKKWKKWEEDLWIDTPVRWKKELS